MVRFKAPMSMWTTAGEGPFPAQNEVRYWSLCFLNFAKIETLSCLPDRMAKVDLNGFVTAVFGGGEEVKALAEHSGPSYFADTRKPSQHSLGFVFREVLPSLEFQKEKMHQGDYLPHGVICRSADFLKKSCGWN